MWLRHVESAMRHVTGNGLTVDVLIRDGITFPTTNGWYESRASLHFFKFCFHVYDAALSFSASEGVLAVAAAVAVAAFETKHWTVLIA